MSTNTDLARIFSTMAKVLDLTGANPFKVSAHARVARILEDLPTDVKDLADDPDNLTAIDGIGDGSAKKIVEFVKTGKVKEHDELLTAVPPGLLEVMDIPGLGPKTVKLLWEQGGVTDMASLKKKLESGELEKLPRMGAKVLQNIRDSMAFKESAVTQRTRLGQAMPLAEQIVAQLRKVKGVKQIEYAGSLRRGCETIGDIDIVVSATDPAAVSDAFRTQPIVSKVLAAGETKSSVRLNSGVQADLRVVDDSCFGAALLYFTGSKQHNVVLRERAIKAGLRLNEYGLFKDDGSDEPPQKRGLKPIAGKTEHEIYKALKLPWIPPELREDRGEIALKSTPELIEVADIKAELHAHTTASDGRMSIIELAQQAKLRGFHTIAVTDHSKSSPQAGGLSPERLLAHIADIREAQTLIKGITILAGSEVDIRPDGRMDYEDDLLAKLDIVIASPHSSLKQDPDKATARLLAAIRHPLVHVIGHPTGRIINQREGLSPKMDKLIEAAVEHDTALEINAHFWRLDLRDSHVKAAVDAGALIAIDTDAHYSEDFDNLRYGVITGRRGWLTAERCINTWSKTKLHAWLKKKR